MTSRIDEMLDAARARLRRLHAHEVPAAVRRGAVLVDIRPEAQREAEGAQPAALDDRAQRTRVAVRPYQRGPAAPGRRRRRRMGRAVFAGLYVQPRGWSLCDLGLYRATDIVRGYRSLAETDNSKTRATT